MRYKTSVSKPDLIEEEFRSQNSEVRINQWGLSVNTVQLRLALFVKVIFSNEPHEAREDTEKEKREGKNFLTEPYWVISEQLTVKQLITVH